MSNGPTATPASRTAWDFLVVAAVLVFLGAITVFLVERYDTDAEKVGSLLGILVPAVGAIFGVSIGYQAGAKKGEADGEANAKKKVQDTLGGHLDKVEEVVGKLVRRIHRDGASPRGTETFEVESVSFDAEELEEVRREIAATRGYLRSLA